MNGLVDKSKEWRDKVVRAARELKVVNPKMSQDEAFRKARAAIKGKGL